MKIHVMTTEEYANWHKNGPAMWTPGLFNPDFDPLAKKRYALVTSSMQADNFYSNHTREECKAEWARRYTKLKNEGR